jgi:ubiquitin carboxyl-terminal hydrolase 8
LGIIQKRPDYQKQKEYIRRLLGGNDKQSEIMDKLENLARSLEVRYKIKQEDFELSLPPPTPEISMNDVIMLVPKTEVKNSVTCMELYEMMEKESSRILIFDCRREDDYAQSNILFNFQCNVPENLCIMGMSEKRVRDKLPNESKVFWEMRKNRSTLIFVDWFSLKFGRNSPAWHLRSILTEWDLEMEKKPEILLLEGGYDRWLMTYPMKCSDPHVKPPKDVSDNFSPSMDDIEYPNVEDIVMKDTSSNASMNKTPLVDRSTKNNAIKTRESMNRSQQELLEYKEQLMNKSIQNSKDLIKLASDYSSISDNKENDEDVTKEQNVLYQIYELNTRQKDMETESSTVDEQLQIIKKEKPIQPSDKSKVEDLENRLKIKADEQKRVKMEAFEKIKARDDILSKARASKPNFQSPDKSRKSEIILSPRALNQNGIPRFDRAIKPQALDPQDFSPVYGTVVSSYFYLLLALQFAIFKLRKKYL